PEPTPEPTPEPKSEPEVKTTPPKPDFSGPEVMVQHGDRVKCPKCGSVKRNMFREVKDMTRLINDYPPIYAKKYICGECGIHFRMEI
ncbi:MAG: hypothetical protein GY870_19630, partial [archaeon]|nr:hypothetical protein [archaeon]